MKKLLLLGLLAVAGATQAQVLWYGGDADGRNGFASERNAIVSDAASYDNFTLTSAANITGAFGNFQDDFNGGCTTAFYDIRTGVSEGNGGVSVGSGTVAATAVDTGNNIFGREVFTYTVKFSTLALGAGTYYIAISPVNGGSGRDFVSTTSGANSVNNVGHPNGNQFLNSSFFGVNYTNWQNLVGQGNWDLSYGVLGTTVPEPASMAVLGLGAMALIRRRRAAKK